MPSSTSHHDSLNQQIACVAQRLQERHVRVRRSAQALRMHSVRIVTASPWLLAAGVALALYLGWRRIRR